jgi:hypothetical protein
MTAQEIRKDRTASTLENSAENTRQKSLLEKDRCLVKTEAAGILSASAQKFKQEIATKITNFHRFRVGSAVRSFECVGKLLAIAVALQHN